MTLLPAKTCLVLTLSACPLVHGCTEVSGGAVEISWNLRNVDGSGVSCGFADVVTINLQIDDDLPDGYVAFPCGDERGVTRFDLAPGTAQLWLVPGCASGSDPVAYRAPPPIVRTITEGEVITLDTQLIEVRAGNCLPEDPCTCQ
jgi:hypothetical protein